MTPQSHQPGPSSTATTATTAAAASHDTAIRHDDDDAAADSQASRRVRTSRPKVKTGCSNCKQRRIKCDERRPSCTQCVRSKKVCAGYPPPARSARPFEEIRIAPKPPAPGPSAVAPGASVSSSVLPLQAAALRPQPQDKVKVKYEQLEEEGCYQYHHHHHQQQQGPYSQQLQPPTTSQWPHQKPRHCQVQMPFPSRRTQKLLVRRHLPPHPPAAVLYYHPSTGLPFAPDEGLYFQLFRAQTASELSGFFDDIFWSRSVLVECHSEAAIRHAVVALGALYKTLEASTESPPTSPTNCAARDAHEFPHRHWEVALRHYSMACNALAVVHAQDERTQRTRLMASVLLACFDSFIGDHKQAILQIQTGLALLERLRAERRKARGPLAAAAGEPVEDELLQMFTRLAIQAKSYDMAFHFPHPYVIHLLPPPPPSPPSATTSTASAASVASEPTDDAASPSSPLTSSSDVGSPVSTHQEPISEQFQTLREARLAWDTLCEHIFRFMELMFRYAHGPPNLLPKSTAGFGLTFKTRLEAWAVAFEPLFVGRTRPHVTSQEKAAIAVLKMFQIMGQILFLMTFSDTEMKFDAFERHFQTIVDLATEVVGDEERRAAAARCPDPRFCTHHDQRAAAASGVHPDPQAGFASVTSHIRASFSADLGIVPPLYVVATKSRNRVLRREAIQLLRGSARREGMWDSELVARIAMWVVEIEEEGEEQEFLATLHQAQSTSVGFGAVPIGSDGYARWNMQHGTHDASAPALSTAHTTATTAAASSASFVAPLDPTLPYYMQIQNPVPAERRILVKACEFDLREHVATLKCGTRGLATDAPDTKIRVTQIRW